MNRNKPKGIVPDTNLLILYIIGSLDPTYISKFKRTKEFSIDDFETLMIVLSPFGKIYTTAHILTEFNNLVEKNYQKDDILGMVKNLLDGGFLEEVNYHSKMIMANKYFFKLGLTDCVCLQMAQENFMICTMDQDLYSIIYAEKGNTLPFIKQKDL